jgi:segregation and condensation protein B
VIWRPIRGQSALRSAEWPAYSQGMKGRSPSDAASGEKAGGGDVPPLELVDFGAPYDQGLSLDELSQAYAALLRQGADPYADDAGRQGDPSLAAASGENHAPEQVEPDGDEQAGDTRASDEAAGQITPRSILEAILFVGHPAGEPLTSERIASLMRGVRPSEIDDLVGELNEEYAAAGAPYSIISCGPGYQMALRDEFAPLRDAFYGRIREARLSQAAIDVLAIVAYHQPVTADDIDRLRGKASGSILSQLVRRDLLALRRPADRKAKAEYRTTARFLDLFGLDRLEELPHSQDIERQL